MKINVDPADILLGFNEKTNPITLALWRQLSARWYVSDAYVEDLKTHKRLYLPQEIVDRLKAWDKLVVDQNLEPTFPFEFELLEQPC